MNKGIIAFVGIALLLVASLYLLSTKDQSTGAAQADLVLYCAAGVKPAVVPLAQQFEREYGQKVQLMYGGSGTLLSNIQVAPQGDLYIAADQSYIEMAAQKELIAETLPLAWLRPVIVVAKGNPKNIRSLEDLKRSDVRIALGNPGTASIGRQTQKLLESAGVWGQVKKQVEQNGVFKPTVSEVANDVKLGAVAAGIVWDATVAQYPELEAVKVELFEEARQQISVAVLASSKQPTAALRFARYLNSRVGNAVFAERGFEAVEGDQWAWHPELTFFCGSVNRRAVDDVIKAFECREGATVNTIYNGCGILTGQMRTINQETGSGFPDVYMACDRYYLENVRDWFQEDVDISEADIVIAVPKGNPKNIQGIADLAKDGMRISVGQPEQCTIGALTRIMLEKMGVYDQVMKNVVMQTASSSMLVPTVSTNSVDATISYITDTKAESDKVDSVRIDSLYAKAIQPFSIACSSDYKFLGRRLFKDISAAEERFVKAGFRFRLGSQGTIVPSESVIENTE
ncbi:putative binding protein precursor [Planctomycetes bacterium CA13]|uniref:Putative binding protein n=1 Tax=Novipirellula herctigrandis TaxID=2527986 RepID=A0A5C5ZB38_9BACT|nr:putative binding protein precursor [Planctomycetes bacterium CA13]